ncbi:MAG: hypothetical protein Q9M32_06945 [Sulfurimonas sp.]|nr:hypothetical protein [Sulfurimonas sp.]MDQ7061114.1 hypothetical protein [Sulfurimonas sp.]
MYKVKVQNACSCFLKSGMGELLEFSTEEQAQKEAQKMLEKMQSGFCRKHEFSMSEKFGDFTILTKPRY